MEVKRIKNKKTADCRYNKYKQQIVGAFSVIVKSS